MRSAKSAARLSSPLDPFCPKSAGGGGGGGGGPPGGGGGGTPPAAGAGGAAVAYFFPRTDSDQTLRSVSACYCLASNY